MLVLHFIAFKINNSINLSDNESSAATCINAFII